MPGCKICGTECLPGKTLCRVHYNEYQKNYMRSWYSKHSEKINSERRKRYQEDEGYKSRVKKWDSDRRYTPGRLLHRLKESAEKRNIPFSLEKKEWLNWYSSVPQVCHYCGISMKELKILKGAWTHFWNKLTVDRLDNSKGYFLDNIVLCCDSCNVIKNKFLSEAEMLEVGKVLKEIWTKKLEALRCPV